MNELPIFNRDIIPVYTTSTGEKIVIGRELHESLSISTAYKDWFPRMCEYGFSEDEDFCSFLSESSGGRPSTNHHIKLEMAKHISMIQRTPKGKAIRDKLIALETNVAELSPELRLLINMEIRQKQHEQELAAVNSRVDGIRDIVALNPNDWRKESAELVNKIALAVGGYEHISAIRKEIYSLIDQRFGVSLKIRLTNKKKAMAFEGASKSRQDKLTLVDVIADDKKLIEGYLIIVKEMAIKHGVDAPNIKEAV